METTILCPLRAPQIFQHWWIQSLTFGLCGRSPCENSPIPSGIHIFPAFLKGSKEDYKIVSILLSVLPPVHPSICLSICLDLANAVTPWPLSRLICSILSSMESSWPINMQQHGHWPVSLRIIIGHTNSCRCFNSITAGEIHAIFSSVELPLPLNVQCYGPTGTQIHADAATSISLDWFGAN